MARATETDNQASLLETVRALPPEDQHAVLSYALFLQQKENDRRAELDEAKWDQLFGDPAKMTRFADWARQSLAQHAPEPVDESSL